MRSDTKGKELWQTTVSKSVVACCPLSMELSPLATLATNVCHPLTVNCFVNEIDKALGLSLALIELTL